MLEECQEVDDVDDTHSNIELFSITKYQEKGKLLNVMNKYFFSKFL